MKSFHSRAMFFPLPPLPPIDDFNRHYSHEITYSLKKKWRFRLRLAAYVIGFVLSVCLLGFGYTHSGDTAGNLHSFFLFLNNTFYYYYYLFLYQKYLGARKKYRKKLAFKMA